MQIVASRHAPQPEPARYGTSYFMARVIKQQPLMPKDPQQAALFQQQRLDAAAADSIDGYFDDVLSLPQITEQGMRAAAIRLSKRVENYPSDVKLAIKALCLSYVHKLSDLQETCMVTEAEAKVYIRQWLVTHYGFAGAKS